MEEFRKSFRPEKGGASRMSTFGRYGPNDTETRQYSPYWSANKWGLATKTLQPGVTVGRSMGGGFDGTYSLGRSRSAGAGVKLRVSPFVMPPPEVMQRVQQLEVELRQLLTSRASFNEDEKTQLLKAFRLFERDLRQRGMYQPQGLVTPAQFRKVIEGVGVGMSEEEAIGFFVKYGCDGEGRLPYDVFAATLLGSRTRLLGLEQVQRGPYKMGGDYTFQGKIIYRFCRKGVFTPTGWDPGVAARSAQLPRFGLKLEFVHGYEGIRNTAQNTFFNVEGKVVYYTAGVGIVYDRESHTQSFFLDHDDDITCIAMHPNRQLFATGQLQSKKNPPCVCIWDSTTLRTIQRIEFPDEEGADMRSICAVGFSPTGDRLVIVTGDDRHSVFVYDWQQGRRLFSGIGKNGQPPQVFGVVWHPFLEYAAMQDPRSERATPPQDMFVTYGQKHVKFWQLESTGPDGSQQYKPTAGKFSIAEVSDVYSALFLPSGLLVTGGPKGELLLWDALGRFGNSPGSCIKILSAHQPGSKIPSPYDGQLVWQGLRALCLRNNATELVTGGADGRVNIFDCASGRPGRLLQSVALPLNGDSDLPACRSLDVHPVTGEMIVGTRGCDLLELVPNANTIQRAQPAEDAKAGGAAVGVDGGIPAGGGDQSTVVPPVGAEDPGAPFLIDTLIDGHEDSVYGLAFHPLRPHKYATACDNMRVHLWDAKRRQLIAKVHVGRMARSVAFSPDGKHLAIGCADGFLKVLSAESLKKTLKEVKYAAEAIEELKYSPDGTRLATGSHDNFIDIYDVVNGYQRIARCYGHSSYVTHLDWSRDSRVLQSNCGAYELLYFDGRTGKQVQDSQRDTMWDTFTGVLGFPVMGIWRLGEMDTMDGTDINATCRSYNLEQFRKYDPISGRGQFLVASSDDGMVRVFNYPCVIENAPCLEYRGHSSHVISVRYSPDNRWVASVGGHDQAVFQWRVVEVDTPGSAPLASGPNTVFVKPRRALVDDAFGNTRIPLGETATGANVPGGTSGVLDGTKGALGATAMAGNLENVPKKVLGGTQPGECDYEITVVTSDRRNSSTDANVYLIMYSKDKSSPEFHLENKSNNFERGKTDVFTVRGPDLGEAIERIRVRHDNSGMSAGWHVASITIRNKTRPGPASVFECNRWLATDEDDGQIVRVFFSGAARGEGKAPRVYEIVVHTSDIRGAGTDANVFLTLFGNAGSFGPFRLENSKNNFERGMEDRFTCECYVGLLESIKIQSDGSGAGPAWHLKDVVIKSAGMESLQFYADRWLSSDTSLECVLFPTKGLAGTNVKPHRYKVTVRTSDQRGAGTDANVTLRIKGENGRDSGPLKLDTSKDNFVRGREDLFFFELPDLGNVSEIDIGHDGSGLGSSWKLDKVLIRDETSNTSWRFLYDDWIPKEGTRVNVVTLRAISGEEGAQQEYGNYRVVVVTSDLKGAGTDARVFIQLRGETGETGKFPLETAANNFERGQRDVFMLRKVKRIGAIKSILIGHDNSGLGAAWHMSHAEITDEATGTTYFFPCNQWFDIKAGDKKIERELVAADPKSSAAGAPTMYKVTVYTGDVKGGGTDADVSIEIFGRSDAGQATTSGRTVLRNSSKNLFERGNADEFAVNCPALGKLERLWIGHNNKGGSPGWNLAGVDVLNMSTGDLISFPYGDWLDAGPPNYSTEVTLLPADAKGDAATALSTYKVVVHTSGIRGAGTDANVFCSIEGEKGRTRSIKLESGRNDFERNAVDTFTFKEANVGKMLKLTIGHDGAGAADAWHLSFVEVENMTTREKAFFVAERWLDKKSGTKVELPASAGRPEGSGGNRYKVTVRTSDQRGAGTDADVTLVLVGAAGRSKEVRLENGADNFERNRTDEFLINLEALDIGELQEIDVGFATTQSGAGKVGSIMGLDWHLNSVVVEQLSTGARYFFGYNDWLNSKKRRVVLKKASPEETAQQDKTEYKVVVRTSDIRGAGSDSSVTLVMFGNQGTQKVDSGVLKLDNSSNNFERGKEDVFDLRCRDLGEITHIEICSDGKGAGPAWHLQDVEITDQRRNKVYHFPCNKWLDPAKDPASLRQVLAATHQGEGVETVELLEYTVTTFTGNERGSGTDADVFVALKGTLGYTAPMRLDGRDNNFERGQRDTFTVKAIDVGELTEIDVSHNNKGAGPDWMLDSVEIYHPKQARSYFFACNDWLKGPGKEVKRTLKAGEKAPTAKGLLARRYRLDVYTSEIRNAGTDSDIFVTIVGAAGDSGSQKLVGKGNLFERGNMDTFHIDCGDLKELKALIVRSDGKGMGSDWHLDKIVVSDLTGGKQYVFPHRSWFNKTEGLEKTLTLDTDGDGSGDAAATALTSYVVNVVTSDISGSGTDAEVFLTIKGDQGTIGPNNLLKSETNGNPFERNQQDRFTLKGSFLGALQEIQLQLKGGGMTADWHLDHVEITCTLDGSKYFFPYNRWFSKKETPDWRAVIKASNSLPKPAAAVGEEDAEKGADAADAAGTEGAVVESMHVYHVDVETGRDRGAGTDDDVFLEIFGPGGKMLFNKPMKLDSTKNDFETGNVDHFTMRVKPEEDWLQPQDPGHPPSLSLIERIAIEKKSKALSMGGDWQLASVVIKDLTRGHVFKWTAPAGKGWFDKKNGNRREWTKDKWERQETQLLELVEGSQHLVAPPPSAFPSAPTAVSSKTAAAPPGAKAVATPSESTVTGAAPPPGDRSAPAAGAPTKPPTQSAPPFTPQEFKLDIFTTKKMGAGTDSVVHVEFEDDAGTRMEPPLPQDKDRYEAGGHDEIVVRQETPPPLTDNIKLCRVWHEGQGMFSKWHLDRIVLTRQSDGRSWTFMLKDWVTATKEKAKAKVLTSTLTNPGTKPAPAPTTAPPANRYAEANDTEDEIRPTPPPAPAPASAPTSTPAPTPAAAPRETTPAPAPTPATAQKQQASATPAPVPSTTPEVVGWRPPPAREPSPPFVMGDGIYVMNIAFGPGTKMVPGDELVFTVKGDDHGGEEVSPPLPAEASFYRPGEFGLKFETGELGSLGDLMFARFWVEGPGQSRIIIAGLELIEEPTMTRWIFQVPANGAPVGIGLGRALNLFPKRVKAGAPTPQAAPIPPPPTSDWERVETEHPDDPTAVLVYFYNHANGSSTYDEPPDYARYEAEYADWYAKYYS